MWGSHRLTPIIILYILYHASTKQGNQVIINNLSIHKQTYYAPSSHFHLSTFHVDFEAGYELVGRLYSTVKQFTFMRFYLDMRAHCTLFCTHTCTHTHAAHMRLTHAHPHAHARTHARTHALTSSAFYHRNGRKMID